MTCQKQEGHFDATSLIVGLLIAFSISVGIAGSLATNKSVRREAELPKQCSAGEQILMTTAPTAELYVCETKWTRK